MNIDLSRPVEPCCEAFKRDPQSHDKDCAAAKRIKDGELPKPYDPWQPWDYA